MKLEKSKSPVKGYGTQQWQLDGTWISISLISGYMDPEPILGFDETLLSQDLHNHMQFNKEKRRGLY